MNLFFDILFWFLLIATLVVLVVGGLMAVHCSLGGSSGGRMRPTRIPHKGLKPLIIPNTTSFAANYREVIGGEIPLLLEKVETILAVKEFRIDRKSVTGHGSTLFQSFEPLRAIDVHPSGRLTVMKEDNGVNSVYGFDDLDEAVETLIS